MKWKICCAIAVVIVLLVLLVTVTSKSSDGRSPERADAVSTALESLVTRLADARALWRTADTLDWARERIGVAPALAPVSTAFEAVAHSLRREASKRDADGAEAAFLARLVVANRATEQRATLPEQLAPFAWPLSVIVVVAVVLIFPDRIGRLLGPVKSLRFFNAEVVLGEKATQAAESTFEALRVQATRRFKREVTRTQFDERFVELVSGSIRPSLERTLKSDNSFRCTLYVPDILFSRHLTQLVDYWPTGTGQGRIFSIYFGIIGKAWRLRESVIEGKIPTTPTELIKEWGMTYDEAVAKGKDRHSFAAIVLKQDAALQAVLYMDCRTENAFGSNVADTHAFEQEVQRHCSKFRIVEAISGINSAVRRDTEPIDLSQ